MIREKPQQQPNLSSDADVLEKPQLKRPPKYAVVLLNDDFTPRDFVVLVICRVFHKTTGEATQIMLAAHTTGKAMCGVFTLDIARSKVVLVRKMAEEYEFPLECRLEAMAGSE